MANLTQLELPNGTTYNFQDTISGYVATDATTSAHGLMSASDKTKLNGIASGAEVNQNAFSNITVGTTTVAADSKTDTLTLVGGANITLTPDATNDKITILLDDTVDTGEVIATDIQAGNLIVNGTSRFLNTINGTASNSEKLNGQSLTSTYSSTGTAPITGAAVASAIGTLDGTVSGSPSASKTLTAFSQTDGEVSATFGNISITKSQVSDFPTLGTAAAKNYTTSVSSGSADLVTSGAVWTAIDNLPEPMVFKGSLGTGGTITALPVDGSASIGDTYKVITAGTYASKAAKVGDTFICLTKTSSANTWELIPSGDEPSGTVTSVGISNGGGLSVSGSPITSSGTITISHADTSSQASVNNSGRTYIQDITLDTYGHVTGITSATETVVNTDRYVNSAAFAHDSTNDNVKMTLTRAGSDTATVTANIPKVSSSSSGVVPKGATVSSQGQTTKFLREDGTWAAPSYTTNTNTTYSLSASGESVVLSGSDNSSKSVSLSTLINGLSTGTSTPVDNDYYVSQYANGGTTTTSYHRRPMSALWAYIQGKTDPRYFMYRGKTTTASDPTLYTSIGTKQYNGALPDGLTSQYTWGQVISIAGENARFDMYVSHLSSNVGTTYGISYRSGWDNDKKPWQTILDSNNYTAYTVKKDGTGATGTWSLNTYEANLQWGGKNFSGSYGCLDAALMDELGANRFQFIKASAITVEYSRDAGETWTDYAATDLQKQQIFAQGGGLVIGKADSTHKATEHPGEYQLRITIDTGVANVYTYLNKFIIYVTTNGSANCSCKIQKALQSTPTTFVDHTDWIPISGWSGYNVLNTASLATYGNTASSQYGRVRFIFKDGTGGNTSYAGLTIGQIKGFGGVGWLTPSTMAKTGHLYSYDQDQNAVFPNLLQAPYLRGTTKMTVSNGKISQLATGTAMLFSDGVAISNPATANDVGWIRVLGTGESDTIMEIATGDDGGAGEQIVVRQYNTSSGIVNEATLLDKSGNTTFPKNVTAAKFIGALQGNADTATSATTASKLGSSNVGSATQPIYLSAGTATACTYTLGKSVPSDAVFTDTKYTAGDNMTLSSNTFSATKRWNAVTQGQKWSRIALVENTVATVGNSSLLHVCCTRGNVVCNATFLINTSHSSYGQITQIGANNYTNFKVRLVVNSSGYYYIEIYDFANSIASGTAQTWYCSLLSFQPATITAYTAFTDGTTVPSGWTANGEQETLIGSSALAIRNITRSGTTFTATRQNGTTFTFTQQDNDHYAWSDITSKPTTISGYGITDAKIASGVITLGSNTITPLTASSTLDATKLSGTIPSSCYTDTKNTAGSTDTSSKIFLIGATSQTSSSQTYSDDQVYVTSGTLQANNISSTTYVSGVALGVTSTAGNVGGISLYGGTGQIDNYGIAFRLTSNKEKHGYVQGDWATYFTMNSGATTRGWVFRTNTTNGNVASISGGGNAVFNGSVTIGGNTTNTSGVRQVYNSTTKSLDFVFVT